MVNCRFRHERDKDLIREESRKKHEADTNSKTLSTEIKNKIKFYNTIVFENFREIFVRFRGRENMSKCFLVAGRNLNRVVC